MAARQIQQYTEAQLVREIERVGNRPLSQVDDLETYWAYYDDLLAEDARRREVRVELNLPATPSIVPAWDVDLPFGQRIRAERVA